MGRWRDGVLSGGMLLALLFVTGCAARTVGSDPAASAGLLPSMQVYTSGEGVGFVLQVTNTTESSIALRFPSAQTYDFIVRRGGRQVWQWSEDRSFAQAIHEVTIAPGETLRYDAEWRPESLAGEFEAIGTLPAIGASIEQSARFELR